MSGSAPRALPRGTVTFLFTDIEGSTRLLRTLGPERYAEALADHTRILREAVAEHDGAEVSSEGDALFAVFVRAPRAVLAAVDAQRRLAAHPWPEGEPVRVRMGLHTGEGWPQGGGYVGIDVHRAARVADAAHGGQVLTSEATHVLVDPALPDGVGLADLGEHRLKDFDEPERIFQVVTAEMPLSPLPLRSPSVLGIGLPTVFGPLVGRDVEMRDITALLDEHRLVTLTGPGGVGKTRLAEEVARELLPAFAGDVAVVRLVAVTDPELVPSTIAATLGLGETPDRPAIDALASHLRERTMLLVLDGFEHIPDAAPFVEKLLGAADGLRCLATSRSTLEVTGEQRYPVPPLQTPDPSHLPEREALAELGAVALFLLRARESDPEFTLTDDNARDVAAITARLDGLPLAIELAAARVRILSPQEILERLDTQLLSVLESPRREAPGRQRTLRGTIRWSYDLLDPDHATAFRRLGVFVGGFTLDSVEAVLGLPDDAAALETVAALMDESLIRRAAGDRRYEMFETVRAFAREELRFRGECEEAAERHATHFLAVAEGAERALEAGDPGPWAARVEAEFANIRAAFDRLLGTDPARALRLFAAIRHWWGHTGRMTDRAWVETALSAPMEEVADADRAVVLAHAAARQGDRDIEAARALANEAVRVARSSGADAVLADTLLALASAHRMAGDYDAARGAIQESRELNRRLGRDVGETLALNLLGILARYADDLDAAVAYHEEACEIAQRRGERLQETFCLGCLGVVERRRGEYGHAAELFSQVYAMSRTHGGEVSETLFFLSDLARRQGDLERAEELLRQSLAEALASGEEIVLSYIFNVAAGIAHERGASADALRLYAVGDALRERLHAPLNPSEESLRATDVEAARRALPDEVADRARSEGAALTREQAIRLVRRLLGALAES